MHVSVIIPTRNEAQALKHVLADIPAGLVSEVLVIDSDSTDGTPEIAARMGARVIREPRRGYGQACLTGLAHASSPDIVVFLDGDYSDRPAELSRLLEPIADGRADITLGSRLAAPSTPGALPWHAVFGNRLAARLIALRFRQRLTDLGPFRAARADVLRALALEETTYGWAVEMILKGVLHGYRILEVPVSYHPRIGKSKISGTVKGTAGAAWFILSRIVRYSFQRQMTRPSRPGRDPTRRPLMEHSSQRPVPLADQNRTLVIMAKAPKPGMVKTRLNQSLPSSAVAALYRCLLEDTVESAKSLSGVEVAVMCPESDRGELVSLLGNDVQVVAQKGEGLAAGLTSVFQDFAAACGRHVIAFNSDSPHLPPSVLHRAFERLSTCDVVLGPTHDGGYYLVGAKAAYPSLFEADGMGTGSALDRLLARTRVLHLSTGFTETFYDIDVTDDLIQLARELRLAPERAPRTAAWLGEWQQTFAHVRHSAGGV